MFTSYLYLLKHIIKIIIYPVDAPIDATLTDIEMQRIKKRLDAASPGPWKEVITVGHGLRESSWIHNHKCKICYMDSFVGSRERANVIFIARSKEDVRKLWHEVMRLRKLNNE